MASLVVRRGDGSCEVLKDCEKKMAAFCAIDAYVDYDVGGRPQDPNVITKRQVHAANRAMRARSSNAAWQALLGDPPREVDKLKGICADLDLIETSDEEWYGEVKGKLESLYRRVMGVTGIGAASGTKVLHLMRPRLVAIADSVVVGYLSIAAADKVSTALATAAAIRQIGRTEGNGATLSAVQEYLRTAGVIEADVVPSACRIIDALLWMRANGVQRPEQAGYHRLWRVMGLSSP